MTSELFNDWLIDLNKKMLKSKLKILLFIDNAPFHGTAEFSNVKLVFFPPNTTSILQPLDQGVIKNFKLFYKSLLLQDTINWIGQAISANQFVSSNERVNVLDSALDSKSVV